MLINHTSFKKLLFERSWQEIGASQIAQWKEFACSTGDARDTGSITGSGRSPGGGNGNPLQYSCLKNPMDRGAWQATVYGVKRADKTERLNMHTQEIEIRSYSLEENIYKPSLWERTCISLCKNSQNLPVKIETIQQKISKGINRHLTVEKIQLSNKHIKKYSTSLANEIAPHT